jgi:hypothetical protein
MDKRIGKFSFFLISIIFFQLHAQQGLKLRVIGKNQDKPVTKLALGVPYTLEIQAEGNQDLYSITIPGLENFHSEFCGASHMSLMSHVTTVHNYILRADKLGTFTLGPAKIKTVQGKEIISNILSLVVDQQEQSDVFVEMVLDKMHIVAGQRVKGKIRFATAIELQLLNLQLPSIDATQGQCTQVGQPEQSKITRDGKDYDCFDFPIELVLNLPGRYGLPKIGACCKVPIKRQRSAWGFSLPLQNFQEQWFYAANSLIVQVDPLPAHSKPVDGIGLFDTFTMSTDHNDARIGEGIVLRLIIEGKEGVNDVKQPKLQIPEGLKYYESKSTVDLLQRGGFKKTFEYIVQGIKSGTWEIPSQVFTFFDTNDYSYKVLKTQSLIVTIQGNAQINQQQTQSDNALPITNEGPFVDNEIYPINNDGPWFYSQGRSYSLPWLIITLVVPFFIICALFIKNYFQRLEPEYWIMRRKKYAFKTTRKKLALMKKNNNITELHHVFTELFADRCQLASAEMHADRIEQILKKAGFVAEVIDQWNRFFLQLAEYAFFNKNTADQAVSHDLLNRAQIWINQLEEKL